MVGHLKFCLVLIFGYLLFHAPLKTNQLFGVSSTLFGVFLYSHYKLKEQKQQEQLKDKTTSTRSV